MAGRRWDQAGGSDKRWVLPDISCLGPFLWLLSLLPAPMIGTVLIRHL